MPIVEVGSTKQLEFGYGDIEVSPGLLLLDEAVGVICFTETERKPIGEQVEYEEPKVLPIEDTQVRMTFEKTKSIDVLIWALEQTKRRMLEGNVR